MTAITLRGLTKRFGPTTAVDEVDLTINSGELFFLLGPSGCGKTTLLRMIAGFIEPTAGSIQFGAKDVTHVPPNRRNAGMVFQSYALWPHMTVEENVAYGLNVRKVPAKSRSDRTLAALKSVHMEEYARRKPNQLSGGQQQRVALARALVIEPTVLLLDEPLSNLDAKLRLEMRSEIRRICTETKITTVYVTHDQKEALSMADNMAVLRQGRIAQLGPPRLLYERPASRFVADFLGETNFIPARVVGERDGAVVVDTGAGVLHCRQQNRPSDAAGQAGGGNVSPPRTAGQAVTCSIRPEAIRIVEGRAAKSVNGLQGKRIRSTYLGEIAQHQIEIAKGVVVQITELHPDLDRDLDEISLQINPRDIVILID